MAIKMICSDIDGTLLQHGRKKLEGEIFDQIQPCMPAASCSARHPGGSTLQP